MPSRIRRPVGLAILAAWLAMLPLPAVWTGQAGLGLMRGVDVLLLGPLGVLTGQFGWFANPLLVLIGLPLATFSRRPHPEALMLIAFVLLILTADTVTWTVVPDDVGEHGIVAHGAGYFGWMIVMVIAAFWLIVVASARGHADE